MLVKAIEEAALVTAGVYRSVGLALPEHLPPVDGDVYRHFADLLARVMPFDLVIDERMASGEQARVAKTSVCGHWGAVTGVLRYFADRAGTPQASIEGTHLPADLLRQYAHRTEAGILYDPRHLSLVVEWRVTFAGFELEREREVLSTWGPERVDRARHALAEALASGEAEHPAVRRNQPGVDEVREVWRRSGGRTAKLGVPELTALYEARLGDVTSMDAFQAHPLALDLEAVLPPEVRERFLALPDTVDLHGETVELDYELEPDEHGTPYGVVWLHLSEELARTLVEEDLPLFDQPARFLVGHGRDAVRADTLFELQELLDLMEPSDGFD
ncbi:hypothetical protein [Melittangium boletus]|uniref:hypothetical protein n=1 Tax=Melittangium boletus TaxID=83453 RepID=UPI003DA5B729